MACEISFDPGNTPSHNLPPWELAKTYAFHVVIEKLVEVTGMSAVDVLGNKTNDFMAEQVLNASGERPTERAVRAAVARCKQPEWFPGKPRDSGAGRKPTYSQHVKNKVADVAMDLKRKRMAPTPRRVRARLGKLTTNPESGRSMNDSTMQRIFSTRCYDETEDDPWQYLPSISQDALAAELKPKRVNCAQWILDHIPQRMCDEDHVAIDPCYKHLPKKQEKLEEQQIAAMGKVKWQSPGSRRDGVNPRAPATAKSQGGPQVTRADWTPVFARGRLRIFVCDPEKAKVDRKQPAKLSDSVNLGKFVENFLPQILKEMQRSYKWEFLPKVLVHDKARYSSTTKPASTKG